MTACPNPVTRSTGSHIVPRTVPPYGPACRLVEPVPSPADPHVDRPVEPDDAVSDWRWGMSGFG